MWWRVLLVGALLAGLLGACAVVDPVDNRYDTVSRSLAKARNEAIFLNLVRASHDYPLSFTTIANVLPSDLFASGSVASVSGFSGTGAALGTIVVFELAGHISDARIATGTHLFDPLMILAGVIPFVGMILVLLLVRNTEATERGLVRKI